MCQNDFSLRNIWSLSKTEGVSLNEGCRFFYKHLPGLDRCASLGFRVLTDGEMGEDAPMVPPAHLDSAALCHKTKLKSNHFLKIKTHTYIRLLMIF